MSTAGGWELPLIPASWRVLYQEALARVELAGGRLDAGGRPRRRGRADRGRARAAAGAGARPARPRRACCSPTARPATPLELALRVRRGRPTRAGAPVEAARSRVLAGTRAGAGGRPRPRRRAAARAPSTSSTRRGALRDRAEARRQLRRLGARTEPRGPSGADGDGLELALTARARGRRRSSRTARRTRRSPASCSSARRPSSRTCATSSPSSGRPRAWTSPARSSATPASPSQTASHVDSGGGFRDQPGCTHAESTRRLG